MVTSWRGAAGVAVALSIAACGSGSGRSSAAASPGGNAGAGPAPAPAPARCDDVTIRIEGTQHGGVTAFSLVLGGATAIRASDGTTLPVTGAPVGTSLDLSSDAAAPVLGKFPLHDGDDAFGVSLTFTAGAVELSGGGAGPLGLCTTPLAFHFDRARLSPERCQVLVLLDLGRSAVPDGTAVAFIPQFRVVY